jgi:GntR family transcriptional regulator, transcriptional repressor for pyruvate dehydrogenase complex
MESRTRRSATKRQEQSPHWLGWQSVRTESASARIVDQVWSALFRGELKPGDFLGTEVQLAQKLGVSRVPVRDAFRTLQALGVIDIKVGAHGGARIAKGNPDRFASALAVQLKLVGISIDEMFDAQIAIEVMAARLAAKRATSADLAKLRAIIDELQLIASKPANKTSGPRFTEISIRFHEALMEASQNRALVAQFKALRSVLEPIYARRESDAVARRVIASHRQLLESIAAGDAECASMLMQRRLEVIRAHQLLKTVD